jgi:hypothetical protein
MQHWRKIRWGGQYADNPVGMLLGAGRHVIDLPSLSRTMVSARTVSSAREQIIRILQSVTDISAAELGRRVGVSRERVRQILKDLGYPTARGKGRPFGSMLPARSDGDGTRLTLPAAARLAAEDLLSKGYATFVPLTATRACDLVAVGPGGGIVLVTVCLPGVLGQRASRARVPRAFKRLERRWAWVGSDARVQFDPPLEGTRGAQ